MCRIVSMKSGFKVHIGRAENTVSVGVPREMHGGLLNVVSTDLGRIDFVVIYGIVITEREDE